MDLENTENQVKKAGSLIDTLWGIFTKSWWKVLIMGSVFGVCYFFYWAITSEFPEEAEVDNIELVEPVKEAKEKPAYKITKKTFMIDDYGYRKGDTIYIDYYDDGFVDKYYTDGQTFADK